MHFTIFPENEKNQLNVNDLGKSRAAGRFVPVIQDVGVDNVPDQIAKPSVSLGHRGGGQHN